jgi:hypothetical protein
LRPLTTRPRSARLAHDGRHAELVVVGLGLDPARVPTDALRRRAALAWVGVDSDAPPMRSAVAGAWWRGKGSARASLPAAAAASRVGRGWLTPFAAERPNVYRTRTPRRRVAGIRRTERDVRISSSAAVASIDVRSDGSEGFGPLRAVAPGGGDASVRDRRDIRVASAQAENVFGKRSGNLSNRFATMRNHGRRGRLRWVHVTF